MGQVAAECIMRASQGSWRKRVSKVAAAMKCCIVQSKQLEKEDTGPKKMKNKIIT